jgi:hypothetical protein
MSGRSAKRRRREAALAAAQRPKRSRRLPSSSVRASDRNARRRRQLLLSVGAAVVIAGVLIGISLARGGSGSAKFTGLKGKAAVIARFKGIPQQGLALGNPKAPVTVEEFADFQCPYCGEWARGALPVLVRKYVLPGKLRIVFRGQDFLDQNFGTSDSERLLRLALAAARQNRLWQVVDLIYTNQGSEGSHWGSEALIRAVANAVPGLDAARALSERDSTWVSDQISAAATRFQSTPPNPTDGNRGTPTFLVGRTGAHMDTIYPTGGGAASELAALAAVIDPLLK